MAVHSVVAGRLEKVNKTPDGRITVYIRAKDENLTFTYAGLLNLSDDLSQGMDVDCGTDLGQIDASSPLRFTVLDDEALQKIKTGPEIRVLISQASTSKGTIPPETLNVMIPSFSAQPGFVTLIFAIKFVETPTLAIV